MLHYIAKVFIITQIEYSQPEKYIQIINSISKYYTLKLINRSMYIYN